MILNIQWNPSNYMYNGHIWGTIIMFWPLYTEVAFVERLFCTQTVHLGPRCLAVI